MQSFAVVALSLFVLLALVLVLVHVLFLLDGHRESRAVRAAIAAVQHHALAQEELIRIRARDIEHISAGRLPHVSHGEPAPAPIALDQITESQRQRALTVAMKRPLALKVGTEVVELDAETVARIEALTDGVTTGQVDGTMLRRLLDAGINRALSRATVVEEEVCEPAGSDSGEGSVAAVDETSDGAPRKSTWH